MNVSNLIEAYINEKSTTGFLPYRDNVIAFFYEKLAEQKLRIKDLKEDNNIKNIYELEISRMEYFIREYLTTRLEKMKNDFFLDTSLMSANEQIFYKKYIDLIREKGLIWEKTDSKTVITVGFICKKDLGNVMLDGEAVEMFEGDMFAGPLSDVFDLVLRGDVCLV